MSPLRRCWTKLRSASGEVMSTEDHLAVPSSLPHSLRLSTGIAGLDDIMGGGLMPGRLYLVEGTPGAGKTTLGLQFLLEGRARGERGLFITLSETNEELEAVAASHGWSLDGIDFFELASAENLSSPDREVTLLHPWEVELGETIPLITDQADRVAPTRVVFDSVSEMRLLAEEPLRFRRQVLALKQFFAARKATVLLLEELILNGNRRDLQLLSLSHGVIRLERWTLDFGGARRRVEITKMRGTTSREGWHDLRSAPGGSRCSRPWSRLSMWVPLSASQCRAVLRNSMRWSTAARFEAQALC
jgi:circadian clock protein KaiC